MKRSKTRKQSKAPSPHEELVLLTMDVRLQYETPAGRAELLEYLQQEVKISLRGVSSGGVYGCASVEGRTKVLPHEAVAFPMPLEEYRLQEGLKWRASTEGSREMTKDTHD